MSYSCSYPPHFTMEQRIKDLESQLAAKDAEIEELKARPLYLHGYEDGKDSRQAEIDRLIEDGEKDYRGMREFQAKYIAASQQLSAAERCMKEIEEHPHCSCAGCAIESNLLTSEEKRGLQWGMQIGHRCAAAIVKRWREPK